jgi:hypothetical protein
MDIEVIINGVKVEVKTLQVIANTKGFFKRNYYWRIVYEDPDSIQTMVKTFGCGIKEKP